MQDRLGEVQDLARLLSTRHRPVQLAGRGRLVIPEGFRQFLGVEAGGEVMVIGAALCVEIWQPAAWFDYVSARMPEFRETLKDLTERITFVHVKDAQGEPGKFQFLLPGEGKTDYAQLFRILSQVGYNGDIVVEVSGQIFSQAGYDPIAAAKKCFAALSPAMKHFGGDTP